MHGPLNVKILQYHFPSRPLNGAKFGMLIRNKNLIMV